MNTFEDESMTLRNETLLDCKCVAHVDNDGKPFPYVFIETGSYDGRTIQQALNVGYDVIHSIELNVEYYNICVNRFKNDKRVHLYNGDSEVWLKHIVDTLKQPATFWLDAHIQEGTVGKHAVPLLHELDIIASSEINNHTIMIDDVRLMGENWWKDVHIDNVKDRLLAINPLYKFTLVDSKAANKDILIARIYENEISLQRW
jgi:hypothetical protein